MLGGQIRRRCMWGVVAFIRADLGFKNTKILLMPKNIAFINYLKENLTAARFENLHNHVGCSKYRLSTLLNGTDDWYLSEIGQLAEILRVESVDLIMKFRIGQKYITMKEMNELVEDMGMKVALVQAA